VTPLLTVLADPDPEVRQMAAFALGLLGDTRRATRWPARSPMRRRSSRAARPKRSA
jgi:hypothetical protein